MDQNLAVLVVLNIVSSITLRLRDGTYLLIFLIHGLCELLLEQQDNLLHILAGNHLQSEFEGLLSDIKIGAMTVRLENYENSESWSTLKEPGESPSSSHQEHLRSSVGADQLGQAQ